VRSEQIKRSGVPQSPAWVCQSAPRMSRAGEEAVIRSPLIGRRKAPAGARRLKAEAWARGSQSPPPGRPRARGEEVRTERERRRKRRTDRRARGLAGPEP
jgi:hypothetical protein